MFQKDVLSDVKSGIVVFLVALPLCLGIALSCNVTALSGIISGVIGGILVTVLSGSKFSVSGPAAGLTAIVITSITQLGNFNVFLAAVVFAGCLQVLFGIIKAGTVANYIPNAVIKGMLAGIGIILIIKQVPHFFGYDKDPEGDFEFFQPDGENSFSELVNMVHFMTPGAIVIGVISFAMLLLAERPFYKRDKFLSLIPGPLLVVIFGTLLTMAFRGYPALSIDPQHLVNLPSISSIAELKNNLMFPDFSAIQTQSFWLIVFTIAAVASLETLLSIEAVDKLDPERNHSNSNKELLAQGIGNIACGLVGGLPVTSVIVRSSANIHAGAKSKLSTIIHAVLLLLSVLVFPEFLQLIPNACLAAILILTGYKLTKLSMFKNMYANGWEQFLPFIVTIIVMLVTDLLKGVGAGLVVAIFFIIRDNVKASFDVTNDIIDGQMYYIVKLPQQVTFFNKGYLIDYFSTIQNDSKVIIDASINKSVNKDVREVISEFIGAAEKRNIKIELIKYHY